ncbi:hypothetical protein ACF1B0_21695 [Streptomyces anandii]|uniref:hypothetical protein n=1 Tax=Streptomyces anandii TaxID=285454 RepID=UPI0036F95BEE
MLLTPAAPRWRLQPPADLRHERGGLPSERRLGRSDVSGWRSRRPARRRGATPSQRAEQVLAADILVLAGPVWLGDNSSVMKRVTERLHACSSLLNEAGRHASYGRVGGCLITGNEDGVKHCARALKDLGGIPAYGNQRTAWDAGCRRDHENPEHR